MRDASERVRAMLLVARVLCTLGTLLLVSEPAFALRPYDSTDADVAKQGEFELELGPVGRRREDSKRIEVAPAVIANFGLAGDRGRGIQGQRQGPVDRDPGDPATPIVANGILFKQWLAQAG